MTEADATDTMTDAPPRGPSAAEARTCGPALTALLRAEDALDRADLPVGLFLSIFAVDGECHFSNEGLHWLAERLNDDLARVRAALEKVRDGLRATVQPSADAPAEPAPAG